MSTGKFKPDQDEQSAREFNLETLQTIVNAAKTDEAKGNTTKAARAYLFASWVAKKLADFSADTIEAKQLLEQSKEYAKKWAELKPQEESSK